MRRFWGKRRRKGRIPKGFRLKAPGLRGTSYPGKRSCACYQRAQDKFLREPGLPHKCSVPPRSGTPHLCGSEELCRAEVINPNGVVAVFAVPPEAQPRWGCRFLPRPTQGSSFLATLGWRTQSRWDWKFEHKEICAWRLDFGFWNFARPCGHFMPHDRFVARFIVAACFAIQHATLHDALRQSPCRLTGSAKTNPQNEIYYHIQVPTHS